MSQNVEAQKVVDCQQRSKGVAVGSMVGAFSIVCASLFMGMGGALLTVELRSALKSSTLDDPGTLLGIAALGLVSLFGIAWMTIGICACNARPWAVRTTLVMASIAYVAFFISLLSDVVADAVHGDFRSLVRSVFTVYVVVVLGRMLIKAYRFARR